MNSRLQQFLFQTVPSAQATFSHALHQARQRHLRWDTSTAHRGFTAQRGDAALTPTLRRVLGRRAGTFLKQLGL